MGVVARNLRTMRKVCWVNVSASSGVGSPRLSWIMGHQMVVAVMFTHSLLRLTS